MSEYPRKSERLDFVGAFEQSWVQYKSNFLKLVPYGFLASVPSSFFLVNISTGIVATLVFQGFLFLLLANAVLCSVNGTRNDINSISGLFGYFKNGIILSLFLLPLLSISFILLIVPSVIFFSFFMFSFFIIVIKDKFAIDALMESLREGFGYRLHFFLFSLIFYSSIIVVFFLSEFFLPISVILNGLLLPYFFIVIYEFYDQMEKK